MAQVLFVRPPHRVIGDEDDRVTLPESPDRVVNIDLCVHTLCTRETGPGRPEFDRGERPRIVQPGQQRARSRLAGYRHLRWGSYKLDRREAT